MNPSTFSVNGSDSFSSISKQYEQEKNNGQVKYNAEEQYVVQVQQYQMRNTCFPFTPPNRQPEMMIQSNFRMTDDPIMLPPPQYQFDNQLIGYPPRQSDQPNYADPAAGLTQSNHITKPKSNAIKRVRTQYTSQQLIQLDSEFAKNNYLSRANRINLSQQLKLTEKQIKVWFQNRRMKNKKETGCSRDRAVSSSHSSYRRNYSPPANEARFQDTRQIQRYDHPPPFSFGPNTFASSSTFHQPIPNQMSANFPASQDLLTLPNLYLREPDVIQKSAMSVKTAGIEESIIPRFNLDENYAIEPTCPRNVGFNFTVNSQINDNPEICSNSSSSPTGLIEL